MKRPKFSRKTLNIAAVLAPIAILFFYVAIRSGPLAPVAVTTSTAKAMPITPSLYGIGTVQARYSFKIGPTYPGRLQRLDVHVGDSVKAGQVIGRMAPVDLDDRLGAQEAAIAGAQAGFRQAQAQQTFAQVQEQRYRQLFIKQLVSGEVASARKQELDVANANLKASQENVRRLQADRDAVQAQRRNLDLIAPVDGLVVSRNADPGTTLVAGQTIIEIIDPKSLWIDARFDQISAEGLDAGLPTTITLRSSQHRHQFGFVSRIEPVADSITEETRAKIQFKTLPKPLPPIGELAEVSVTLPTEPAHTTIPNASIRTIDGKRGVLKLVNGRLEFAKVILGKADLDGNVQVLDGVSNGEQIVVYSEKTLHLGTRVHVTRQLAGTQP